MHVRIGINGFGRIGRLLARTLFQRDNTLLTHINDPACTPEIAAHLLEFDSTHGRWDEAVAATESGLTIRGQTITLSQERQIDRLDWGQVADIVIDCSGRHKTADELQAFINAGAKKVILSAPITGAPNIVLGVNEDHYQPERDHIVSAASCTTNCLAVVAKIIHEEYSITNGFVTTIHALTNDQALLDQAHEDWRRGRTAIDSLIPTTSGFARTIGSVIPELAGRLDGYAVRAPVTNASLIDCAFTLAKSCDAEQVNAALAAAANGPLRGLLAIEPRPLVSADYRGAPHSATVDSLLTRVLGGRLLKLVAWYDNETGYVNRLAELSQKTALSLDK